MKRSWRATTLLPQSLRQRRNTRTLDAEVKRNGFRPMNPSMLLSLYLRRQTSE
jgi:hypothetical protein